MSLTESLQDVLEWEAADARRLADVRRRVEVQRAHGDAEIARLGLEAASLLTDSGVPSSPATSITVTRRVGGITTKQVILGSPGWSLGGSGFAVSTDGDLLQIWFSCAFRPTFFAWQPARCWRPSDGVLPVAGQPKLRLWPEHDRVCLDERNGCRPLEEIVATGIRRLLRTGPVETASHVVTMTLSSESSDPRTALAALA